MLDGQIEVTGAIGPYEFSGKEDLDPLDDTRTFDVKLSYSVGQTLSAPKQKDDAVAGTIYVPYRFATIGRLELVLLGFPLGFSSRNAAYAPFEENITVGGVFGIPSEER